MVGPTKVLLSSYTCKWSLGFRKYRPEKPKPLSWFVDLAGSLGLDGVQLADNIRPERLPDAELEELLRHAAARGLELQWGFEGWDEAVVRRLLEMSGASGATLLRGVFGADFSRDAPPGGRVAAAVRAVEAVLPELERRRVVLALENHFDLSVRELVEVVERIDSPLVRICLDTTNALGELMRPLEAVELLGPHSVSMHFKDFRIEKVVGGYTILGAAVGEGQADCAGLLARALAVNPDLEVCIELGAPFPQPMEAMHEVEARETRVSVENTLRYLRALYGTKVTK